MDQPRPTEYGYMPYWLLVAAGLGIFLGCVGKSAQFPLHVWLPDAMEGPTPVSALIHAATMVAAGVYLVGRTYPLFTPEVLLTIAYVGAITLFVAATIAVVMTDIKKVLAYSTVSQLGYMMLGLGVGGWAAGLFHLITHAFFKALLFLGSGSVIFGCHHQQDMMKMGGLYPKMKVTALTMLMGVLAIAGIPLFSGWYSKDAVVANAMGFGLAYKEHLLLFLLPLVTAGITTFYMFRMWFMTFTGEPRDHHVHEHAHESPWVMTVPLILLAVFSVCVAWPIKDHHGHMFPLLNAEASWLEHQIHHSQHGSVKADFSGHAHSPMQLTAAHHDLAGMLALAMVIVGLTFAFVVYYWRLLDPAEGREQFPGVHGFLTNKWRFDELYSAILVRPALAVAAWCKNFDLKVIDGILHGVARVSVRTSRGSGRFDLGIVDGLVNLLADVWWGIGAWLRNIQTGYLRSYILFLALAAVGIWIILSALLGAASGAGR
jgi:NADH-quinone oxidoreductase subunit L